MIDRVVNEARRISERVSSAYKKIKDYPQESFRNSLETAVVEKRVTETTAAIIRRQINEPGAVAQITDIYVCSGLIRVGLKPFDLAVGASALYHGDPTLALYIFAAHHGSRFLYLGSRITHDWLRRKEEHKLSLKRDLLTLLITCSPIPYTGEFAAPYRATSRPEMGKFAIKDTAHKISSLFKWAAPNNYNLPTIYRPGL
jgi:hypothetical protein